MLKNHHQKIITCILTTLLALPLHIITFGAISNSNLTQDNTLQGVLTSPTTFITPKNRYWRLGQKIFIGQQERYIIKVLNLKENLLLITFNQPTSIPQNKIANLINLQGFNPNDLNLLNSPLLVHFKAPVPITSYTPKVENGQLVGFSSSSKQLNISTQIKDHIGRYLANNSTISNSNSINHTHSQKGELGSAFVILYAWNPSDHEYQVLMGHHRHSHYKKSDPDYAQIDRRTGRRPFCYKHPNKDYWNLCGGRIDPQETPEIAACRETYEESVRWYGSDLSKNLKGKHLSFEPQDLTDYFYFSKPHKKKLYDHYVFFKEVSYLDPQMMTSSINTERDRHFKENDDYGWLSWKTFAYHAIKEYLNHGHINQSINEKMKKDNTISKEAPCRDFTWRGFREARGADFVLQITNKERDKQGSPPINNLTTLNAYLTDYYPNQN